MFVEPIVFHCDANVLDNSSNDRMNEQDMSPSLERIVNALWWDHCDEFVQLIRYEHTVGPLRKLRYVIAPSALLDWAIRHGAVRCAESLLSGAAGVSVNIRKMILWTPTQSVYELIFTLGCSMELKNALLTISHILRALPVKQTQNAICQYARGGYVFELTCLLYVDAAFELGIFKGLNYEYFALRKSVVTSISSSLEEGPCFVVGSSGVAFTKVEKQVMKSVLLLLELFNRTNFSMLGSKTVRAVLEKRINNAGFDLTNLQNMDDVHVNHVKATEVVKVIKPMVDHPQRVFGTSTLKPTSREMGQFRTVFTRKLYTPLDARSPVMKATYDGPQLLSCTLRRTWPVLASAFRRIVHV